MAAGAQQCRTPQQANAASLASSPFLRCRRRVGLDSVVIDIGEIKSVDRDASDDTRLTLLSGQMFEKWQLKFPTAAQRQIFYQALVIHHPFGKQEQLRATPIFVFTGHFRAIVDPIESDMAEFIPHNADAYAFGIAGGTLAQRERWVRSIQRVSAIAHDCEDPWLYQLADDEQDGGSAIVVGVDPKYRRLISSFTL